MHKARVLAFQIIYNWEFSKLPAEEIYKDAREILDEDFDEAMEANILLQVRGTLDNISTIDNLIKKNLKNWEFSRISKIDLAILRLSIYGLLFLKDIDGKIIIDEALKLSNEFGKSDSYRFINGILDSIYKANDKN